MHEDSPDDALVGTGSGLGASSASIDELLGGESRTASEEGVMPGFSALARQVTAVQEGGAREAGDMDMPQALYEEDEPSQEQPVLIQEREDDDGGGISPGWDDNPDLSSSLAILTDPTMLDRAYSYSGSTPSTDHAAVDVVSPSAANPRPAQYTFLSTTARSPPINHNGMNGHRNAAEDGTGEDVAGDGMEVEPQPIREGMRPREFIDMMFT